MQYPELSHQELPKNYDYYTTEFFLPWRENPVAILRYEIILKQVIIRTFCTVNWVYPKGDSVYWIMDEIDRIWRFDFWKNLYPWIWTECLDLFIRKLRESEKPFENLELRSVPSAIWFYRKAASRLLEQWSISSWKQWNWWDLIKKIPISFIKYLWLDIFFRKLDNPDKFSLKLQ